MIPDRITAVPSRYIPSLSDAKAWSDVPPGHRFLMYFAYWEASRFSAYKDARLPDIKHLDKKERDRIRKQFEAEKKAPLGEVCPLGHSTQATLKGLRQRQQALITSFSDNGLTLRATSTAPFATGLGNEHPIENGFAFLTPYGLPYLAGSSVKGVLRRAAEELALFADEYTPLPHPDPLPQGEGEDQPAASLTLLDVWWLFGFEGAAGAIWPLTRKEEEKLSPGQKAARALWQERFSRHLSTLATRPDLPDFIRRCYPKPKEHAPLLADPNKFLRELDSRRQEIHTRGALDFWDVFPAPAGNKLVVEIMTPHHAGYYMKGEAPHDAESPVPVPFLAVPAGSAFDFHVVCAANRLPDGLRNTWKTLLGNAFSHAFDWLGFGAKTAVGYGAMKMDKVVPAKTDKGSPTPQALASRSIQAETRELVWPAAKLTLNPGTGEIKAYFEGMATAGVKGEEAQTLLVVLAARAAKLKKDKELKNVPVLVRQQGNLNVLIGLVPANA